MSMALFGGCGNNVIKLGAFAIVWKPREERLGSSPSQRFAHGAHSVADTQIDRRETPKAHIFKADLPGLKKMEVKVQLLEGRLLEIRGERKKEV